MSSPFSRAMRSALVASLLSSAAPVAALAGDQTVAAETTDTAQKTVTDTDALTIEDGGTLDVDDTGIVWQGPSAAPGVTIDNSRTITTTDRGIDTDNDETPRVLTLDNRAGATIDTADDTFRIDTEFDGGRVTVNNDGLMHSAGGQTLDFDAVTSPNAFITINNGVSGVISADDNDAIRPGAGTIVIDNSGQILSTASVNRAINASDYATITGFHLINEKTGRINSIDDAVRIDGDEDTQDGASGVVVVDNYGKIVSSGTNGDGGQAIDFDSIYSDEASVTINNYAGGEIRAEDADAIRPGEGGVVNNYGSIVSNASDADPSNDGVDMQGHAATVNNYAGGTISGARHGITSDVDVTVYNEAGGTIRGRNGSGVGSDGTGSVVNYGLISGDADTVSELSDGDGVDIDFEANIVNYGTIQGTGARGQKPGDTPNASEGVAVGGGTINNAGADAVISGADNGILVDDGSGGTAFADTTITNRGTIRGINGFGITLTGVHADTVTNSGLIAGGNGLALDMGGGDDTLNVETGAKFDGAVDGGDGTDTVNLDGTGTFAGARNFEYLDVVSGTWRLTGTQSYSGGVSVASGSMLGVDGTLDSMLTIGDGALLNGTGTLGGVRVEGTVAPGHSIGTLTVTGAYVQTAGSTYRVEIDPSGASDLIEVGGSASLAGTVEVLPASGTFGTAKRYTVLTAGGGVSGRYDALDGATGSPFLDFALSYDPNAVYLDLSRNGTGFADVADTRNQRAAAAGLESLGAGNTLYDAIVGLASAGEARAAYDGLSGEIHASTKTGLIEDSRFIREAVGQRIRAAFADPQARPVPVMGYAAGGSGEMPAAAGTGVWAHGFGSWGTNDGDGNTADLDRSIGGAFIGADGRVGRNWLVGLAGGYSRSTYDVDGRNSTADTDTYTIAAYAGTQLGGLGLRFGAANSWHSIDTRRSLAFPGFSGNADASYDARTAQVFGEAAYDFSAGRATVEPFAGLSYVNLHTNSFGESGTARLEVRSDTTDVTFTTIGLRASTPFALGAMAAHAHGTLGWRHALGDTTPTATAALAGGDGFTVDGVPIAEDAAVLKAGLDFDLSPTAALDVSYSGQVASDAEDHGVNATFTIKF